MPGLNIRACVIPAALTLFLIAGSTSALASGAVTIVNGTRTAMITLQMKASNGSGWQGDVLGGKPLGVRKRTTAYPSACVCDIRASFEDGHRVMRRRVDVCSTPVYIVQDF